MDVPWNCRLEDPGKAQGRGKGQTYRSVCHGWAEKRRVQEEKSKAKERPLVLLIVKKFKEEESFIKETGKEKEDQKNLIAWTLKEQPPASDGKQSKNFLKGLSSCLCVQWNICSKNKNMATKQHPLINFLKPSLGHPRFSLKSSPLKCCLQKPPLISSVFL